MIQKGIQRLVSDSSNLTYNARLKKYTFILCRTLPTTCREHTCEMVSKLMLQDSMCITYYKIKQQKIQYHLICQIINQRAKRP